MLIKVGSRIGFKSKEMMIEDCGKGSYGYPKTDATFNFEGKMDHIFEETGVITELNTFSKFPIIAFDNQVEGLSYTWAYSEDMFVVFD